MVEILLCTQQWLQCYLKSQAEVSTMLEEIAFFDSLGEY